jgi:cytidylate kinase
MPVIAMTREIATRGSEVAAGLAARLGLTVIHPELVEHEIAERSGMPENTVHRFLEGETSLWDRWKLDRLRVSQYTAQEILELAARGNILIRGWSAASLLRFIPHVVCVRICAPMSFREGILMERLGTGNAAAARHEILQSDAAHNGAMQTSIVADWKDPSLYAMVLNTARIPVEDCVEQIARLTERAPFLETADSRAVLLDELILARIRCAMDKRFGPKSLQNGFEVNVFGGKVLLSGASTDEHMIVDALRLLQGIEGVKGVECKVAHVAFVPHVS